MMSSSHNESEVEIPELKLYLLDFKLTDNIISNDVMQTSLSDDGVLPMEKRLFDALNCICDSVKWTPLQTLQRLGQDGFTVSFVSEHASHCVVRYYGKSRLITFDIQGDFDCDPVLLNDRYASLLVDQICSTFSAKPFRDVLTLPRISKVNKIFLASDQAILTYDFDKVLFDQRSAYQHVQIFRSNEFGNVLVLDDFINLAESDIIYTHSIMCKGRESYTDKEVLILGGGDGAILYEVLKENPKFVFMIDIDDAVVQACRQFLRRACGNVLDSMKGPNYEIIIDDCFPHLKRFADEGKKFDYVFGDLTDVPLDKFDDSHKSYQELDEFWNLTKSALTASLAVLKPDGKFLTHVCGIRKKSMIEAYEKMLIDWPLNYDKSFNMVPSFLETWTFFAVSKKN